ncbi:sigma-54-dependent Fis family transcriptional regulator [Acidocella sp. C78]|uniref:sigma-54-dependent Fis family transcriptional regulator n=1 Tax=Acidocella sp. C78 TaxID=1671486 RepID=UPI00191BB06F|nr:sigma 54-interacting transcriptional regulator [Acidocella sp. C78]
MLAHRATDSRLAQARSLLELGRAIPAGLLAAPIAASWRRCLDAGLEPHHPPPVERIERHMLERHRAAHETVRRLARAEMQTLQRQLGRDSFMLAFADPEGVLLDALASEGRRTDIEAFGIVPGTVWQEAMAGTNALGTASEARQRMVVRGAEHFFTHHQRLTCIAAPIFLPDRTLAGVLDATCFSESYAPNARAIVALAAAEIEARLFRARLAGKRLLAFHGRAEFIDTAYAGLLALDAADRVVAANDQARFILAGLAEPVGAAFGALFAPGELRPGTLGTLTDRSGRLLHARLDQPEAAARPRALARAPEASAMDAVVADDPAARAALDMAARAAVRGMPVLIRGATGTGKEVAARYAHRASGRNGRFVAVNCAAIPPDLIAAELFGHVEGAFTGARRGGANGLAVEADGGTLFLDEIGDLPLPLQAALLRFLDDFSVRAVGGGAPRLVDVLLLTATNVDLAAAVAAGRFRADLYYRLAIAEITLPALKDRNDVRPLAAHLLEQIAPGSRLDTAAAARLARHEFPGNIRELRNLLARAALGGDKVIGEAAIAALLPAEDGGTAASGGGRSVLRDVQAQRIEAALRAAGGNVSRAARALGVSRNTIYRAIGRTPPAAAG